MLASTTTAISTITIVTIYKTSNATYRFIKNKREYM